MSLRLSSVTGTQQALNKCLLNAGIFNTKDGRDGRDKRERDRDRRQRNKSKKRKEVKGERKEK